MPATISQITRTKLLGSYTTISNITIGAYATGGVSVTPAQLGLEAVEMVIPESTASYVFTYDYANKKLKVVKISDGTEAANAADLSGVTVRVLAIGK